ncbi:transglycosylase SLT domain-containing protein [Candidatus Fermentibacteria bacterium]|nr:transglycosylase SLT domain-containing protein [Candidatus Fermentibacteria bacterium]
MPRSVIAGVLSALLLSGCGSLSGKDREGSASTYPDLSRLSPRHADSVLEAGDTASTVSLLVRSALLRPPGDPDRAAMARRAARMARPPNPVLARLLLEEPDSLAPFQALRLGGTDVADLLTEGMEEGRFALPEYVALFAARTFLDVGRADLALRFARTVPVGLPRTADRDRSAALYEAALLTAQDSLATIQLDRARVLDDSELLARLYHLRGLVGRQRRAHGWRKDLMRSFKLWPAADFHARAYALLRDTLLADSSLAAEVADPFYSGGLWNELYDLASRSASPAAHLYYLAARTRDRLGFYNRAVEMLESYLDTWPEGNDAPLALLYLGLDRARGGFPDAGLATLDLFESRYPRNPRTGNVPWYRGSILTESGRWEEALAHFRRTVSHHPGNVTADDAHFYLCLGLYRLGHRNEAARSFAGFLDRWSRSVYRNAARYWLGRTLLETGDPEGREILLSLISEQERSLPASFARSYLGMPGWRPRFSPLDLESWMDSVGVSPAEPPQSALRGRILQRCGMRDWAVGEYLRAEEEVGGPAPLAPFYLANEVWERMPSAAWRMWSLGEDLGRPRGLWTLRYPRAWESLVVSVCDRYGFDPLLAWSIMKQESAFQPSCYSTAGARGLIQMIPSTSEYLAEERDWSDYSPDKLYLPEVSIEYGVAYLSEVAVGFDRTLETLAAYNGGPHNAMRWGARRESPEGFFSRITYNETKLYAEIVSHNYEVYKSIYGSDEALTRASPDSI